MIRQLPQSLLRELTSQASLTRSGSRSAKIDFLLLLLVTFGTLLELLVADKTVFAPHANGDAPAESVLTARR